MYPNRTFNILMGTGSMLALLVCVAAYRAVLAGCPEKLSHGGFACFFLPTHTDLSVHLLSYILIGIVLLSTSSLLILWLRQWTKINLLKRNLAVLHVPGNKLELLTRRLGLKDEVHLLDSEDPFCFCAGFISPGVYLSRSMMDRLTPEQLEALLLHEKYHLENYDPLKILLGKLVVTTIFFVPALQDILSRYLIEKEIAADRSVLRYQGHFQGIVGALDKLLQWRSIAPAESLAVGATDALEYRIDYLTGHASQHWHRISFPHLVTSFLTIALILAAVLVPLSGSHP